MKLVWHSNAPWSPTGYGQQTALFAHGLADHYDLAISSFFGLQGAPITWEGIPVFPGNGGNIGDTELVAHAQEFFGGDLRDGLIFTLLDVWTVNPALAAQCNMVCWTPIDHEPPPPKVIDFLIKSGAIPVAMSRFGERMLGRLDPLYCPHAVDTEVYRPRDRNKVRDLTEIPQDAFVAGMVAANKGFPSRKGFQQAFRAFQKLIKTRDDAYLYLHTVLDSSHGFGENIPLLLEALDIPDDRVRIANQYRMQHSPYSGDEMSLIYSNLDVLLNPSLGEGFGVPQLEAQACGVPVIATDFTAMTEVVGSGWLVKHTPFWTHQNSWQAQPDVNDIHKALKIAAGRSEEQAALDGLKARAHAEKYALPEVLERHMLPALRVAEQRFELQRPIRIAPRAKVAA